MLINPTRLTIDELVERIIVAGDDLSKYYDNIDDEIYSICWVKGVLPADVPVDQSGYVTSIPLALCATYYGIYRICSGYIGTGSGDPDDVYSQRAREYYDMYMKKRDEITKSVILGGDMVAVLNPVHTISSGFFAI